MESASDTDIGQLTTLVQEDRGSSATSWDELAKMDS